MLVVHGVVTIIDHSCLLPA